MRRLLLASRSPARAAMLRQAGVAFEIVDASLDEADAKARLRLTGHPAGELAARLAQAKALCVDAPSGVLVLGADQTLEFDGDMLDKPGDLDGLRRQLSVLRGKTHRLHSAAALVLDKAVAWTGATTAELTMRSFSDAFLDRYVSEEGEAVLGCVGGYRVEGPGVQLFDRIEGDHFTIMGLPLIPLLAALRSLGGVAR